MTSVPRTSWITVAAFAAAPLACAMESGMSLGPVAHPLRYTPSIFVSKGVFKASFALKNPYSSSSSPKTWASSSFLWEGIIAELRTIISASNSATLP